MPKLKTHKGAARRIKITATGKMMRTKGGKSHLRRKKPARVRRQYDGMLPLSPADQNRISRILPYGVE
ncbi:MAG: 50S ribosomal protein L35 [Chloroflexi bacterium]|nr:50S ribosomal protein L35 [Chloroflexota bacterium]